MLAGWKNHRVLSLIFPWEVYYPESPSMVGIFDCIVFFSFRNAAIVETIGMCGPVGAEFNGSRSTQSLCIEIPKNGEADW